MGKTPFLIYVFASLEAGSGRRKNRVSRGDIPLRWCHLLIEVFCFYDYSYTRNYYVYCRFVCKICIINVCFNLIRIDKPGRHR